MKNLILLTSLILWLVPSAYAQEATAPDVYLDEYHRASRSGNSDSIALSCYHLSEFYIYKDNDSINKYTMEGLKHVDRKKVEPYVYLLNNLGYYYNAIGDSRKSVNVLLEALREAKRLKADNVTRGDILSSIGVGYRRINMVDSALYCYNAALTSYKENQVASQDDISFLLANIAVLYANSSRLDEAESYARQSMQSLSDSTDLDTRMYVSNTAGSIFVLQKKYQEAESVMLSSLDWARHNHKSRFILQCISPLMSLYHRTGNRKALDALVAEAQPLIAAFPANSNEVLGFQETLAIIYMQEKRYKESAELFHRQLDAFGLSSQTPLENIYLNLARNYSHLNKTSLSADYYEKAYATLDSIHHSEINEALSDFSAKYETQQKELEIVRLREERLQQKNLIMKWSLIAGFLVVVLVLCLTYVIFRNRQQKHEAELEKTRSFLNGLEKERTRLAKELHDGICNDLLGIGMMLNVKEKDEETTQAIVRSVESVRAEVRAISHELTPPKFRHTSLDEIIEQQLGSILTPHGISLSLHKQGNVVQWKHIPDSISFEVYRIIQEVSSNIVLHSEATHVDLNMCTTDTRLDILIVNDGKEFNPDNQSNQGIGLSTIFERVKSIGADFSISYDQGQQISFSVSWIA